MLGFRRFLFIYLLLISVFVIFSASYAEVPRLINYQGRLTDKDSKPLADSAYQVTFRIYDAENAGNLLWQETQTVNTQKGMLNVLLGSVTSLDLAFDKQYFLEIKVGDEAMSPRQRITSSAYAIRAEHGVPKGVIVMWSGKISDIPNGWILCDGANGTPDLRDRFVVGARQDDGGIAKTNVTGLLTQIGEGSVPAHTHEGSSLVVSMTGAHTHDISTVPHSGSSSDIIDRGYSAGMPTQNQSTSSAGEHKHAISGNTSSSGLGTKNIAVYYALVFIMKL